MKTVSSILFFSFIVLTLTSCTKESFDQKIVGKWQISEVSGFNGTNYYSTTVPEASRSTIEVFDNGGFVETMPASWGGTSCTGTYSILKENQAQFRSNCSGADNVTFNISKKTLIRTKAERDDMVTEKFIKIQ